MDGEVGCSNCRERYPIEGGVGDLRWPPSIGGDEVAAEVGAPAPAALVGGLLGITSGGGHVLLVNLPPELGVELAPALPEVEFVVTGQGASGAGPVTMVSHIAATGPVLPFFPQSFRGIAVRGTALGWVEAARLLSPIGRLVVLDPPPGTATRPGRSRSGGRGEGRTSRCRTRWSWADRRCAGLRPRLECWIRESLSGKADGRSREGWSFPLRLACRQAPLSTGAFT